MHKSFGINSGKEGNKLNWLSYKVFNLDPCRKIYVRLVCLMVNVKICQLNSS